MAGKFDIQKIIADVKSIINPVPIPEASKDDPVAFYLSELNKLIKELAETHTKQADVIAKLNPVLGSLYQEVMKDRPAPAPASEEKAPEAAAEPAPAGEEKTPEAAAEPAPTPAEGGDKSAEGEKPCCGDTEDAPK